MNDARVEHDAVKIAAPEGVPVGTKPLYICRNGLGRGYVLDVVVAGDIVERNRAIECRGDAKIFGDLRGVSRLVHEVTGHDQKGRMQPVRGGDGELEVRRFLCKILVVSEHAELRVAELEEEERRGSLRSAALRDDRDWQRKEKRSNDVHFGSSFRPASRLSKFRIVLNTRK